jgi:hypothetical protein
LCNRLSLRLATDCHFKPLLLNRVNATDLSLLVSRSSGLAWVSAIEQTCNLVRDP